MKKNKATSQKLLEFISSINGFVQFTLFIGTFIYIFRLSSLPFGQLIIATILWLIAIAPVSIILNAFHQHKTHLEKQSEYDANNQTVSLSIPPLRIYIIRNLFIWLLYVAGVLVIILATVGMIYIIFELAILFHMNHVWVIFFIMIPLSIIILTGAISTLLFISVPEPLLDFYLYPNVTIQKIAYKNSENPLTWQKLKAYIRMLVKGFLILSLYMGMLLFISFVPEILEIMEFADFWVLVLTMPIDGLIIYIAYRIFKISNKGN